MQIQDIMGTKTFAKAVAEAEAARLDRRREITAEIKAVRAKAERADAEHKKAVAVAEEKYLAAEQTLSQARQELAQARGGGNGLSLNHRIGVLEAELRASADLETISAFRREMDALGERVRHRANNSTAPPGNEVSTYLARITAVRRAVDELPLELVDKTQLQARLVELRESIKLPE